MSKKTYTKKCCKEAWDDGFWHGQSEPKEGIWELEDSDKQTIETYLGDLESELETMHQMIDITKDRVDDIKRKIP